MLQRKTKQKLTHRFSAMQQVSSYLALDPSFFLLHNGLCIKTSSDIQEYLICTTLTTLSQDLKITVARDPTVFVVL